MNVKGMSNPTIMYVDNKTNKVMGPSIPTKASGKEGWSGRPEWVENVGDEWVILKDKLKIQAEQERRKPFLAKEEANLKRNWGGGDKGSEE